MFAFKNYSMAMFNCADVSVSGKKGFQGEGLDYIHQEAKSSIT